MGPPRGTGVHESNIGHGLANQPARFMGLGVVEGPVEHRELVVLPVEHPDKKTHDIGLLLPSQLLDVLISPHLGLPGGSARGKEKAEALKS